MSLTIKRTYFEGDEEIVLTLPAKMEVCGDCHGQGAVLCEGMRGYAYSAEEFAESFDDEEAEEYFTRGGRYDVACPTCNGANVVPVVDEDRVPSALAADYEAYQAYAEVCARADAEDRATRFAENGYRE